VQLVATAMPCIEYPATVSRIGGEIGRTRSLIVEATIDKKGVANPSAPVDCTQKVEGDQLGLVPGMFAEAQLTIAQVERPVIPATAVAQRGKTWHTFVAVNGELQDRIVLTGPSNTPGTLAIVRGDLNPGDKVANNILGAKGDIKPEIVDGARIEGASAAPAPAAKPTAPSTGSNK